MILDFCVSFSFQGCSLLDHGILCCSYVAAFCLFFSLFVSVSMTDTDLYVSVTILYLSPTPKNLHHLKSSRVLISSKSMFSVAWARSLRVVLDSFFSLRYRISFPSHSCSEAIPDRSLITPTAKPGLSRRLLPGLCFCSYFPSLQQSGLTSLSQIVVFPHLPVVSHLNILMWRTRPCACLPSVCSHLYRPGPHRAPCSSSAPGTVLP